MRLGSDRTGHGKDVVTLTSSYEALERFDLGALHQQVTSVLSICLFRGDFGHDIRALGVPGK